MHCARFTLGLPLIRHLVVSYALTRSLHLFARFFAQRPSRSEHTLATKASNSVAVRLVEPTALQIACKDSTKDAAALSPSASTQLPVFGRG
jgi:hypothetical protein